MQNDNQVSNEAQNQREEIRYSVLSKLYEISEGDSRIPRRIEELEEATGLGEVDLDRVLRYLHEEELVEKKNLAVRITHAGVKEIEQSIKNPALGTEHFSPTIVQNFNAPVGAVQNASHSVANVNQHVDVRTVSFNVLIKQIRDEISQLPENEREEASELVDSLVEQVESPAPRWATVKAIAGGLGQFISSTASSVLADYISKTGGG